MKNQLILFGTGFMLPEYQELLHNLNIEIFCYTDNNPLKWGTFIDGKKIIPPKELPQYDNKILISCGYFNEIRNQLKAMGIEDRIVRPYGLTKRDIENHFDEFDCLKRLKPSRSKSEKVIIDALDGIGWGGAEIWSYTVAQGLSALGHEVEVIGSLIQVEQPPRVEKLITRYAIEKRKSWEIIRELVRNLSSKMPFVLINNATNHVFLACYILKHFFPEEVKIITVSHTDLTANYERQTFWENSFDEIICVSTKIKKKMNEQYGIKEEKLHYKESIVDYDGSFEKSYCKKGEPLRIGYAGRLEILDKRADLIPGLIKKLEQQHLNYIFEIAGSGTCFDDIKKFVDENDLNARVILSGFIRKNEMPDFWKRQDVFVNLSELEGTSLSMLEAMSYGVVPVVTDVSGVRDFIVERRNGCISEFGDLDAMAKNIGFLAGHKEKLPGYGAVCREEIKTRCRKSDYVDYVAGLCGFGGV